MRDLDSASLTLACMALSDPLPQGRRWTRRMYQCLRQLFAPRGRDPKDETSYAVTVYRVRHERSLLYLRSSSPAAAEADAVDQADRLQWILEERPYVFAISTPADLLSAWVIHNIFCGYWNKHDQQWRALPSEASVYLDPTQPLPLPCEPDGCYMRLGDAIRLVATQLSPRRRFAEHIVMQFRRVLHCIQYLR